MNAELPRYRLTQKAYMPKKPGDMDEPLASGTEVVFTGTPGEHLEPLNEAARDAVAASVVRPLRPELSLPMQAAGGGEAGAMLRQSLGTDLNIDANVVAIVAQLLVRVNALEARVAELTAGPRIQQVAPPPPPLPRRATA